MYVTMRCATFEHFHTVLSMPPHATLLFLTCGARVTAMGSLFQAASLPSTMILRYARERKPEERGREEGGREGYTETQRHRHRGQREKDASVRESEGWGGQEDRYAERERYT